MGKIGVFLADGFETIEALTVVDYMRRAGLDVYSVSAENKEFVKSAQKVDVKADLMLKDLKSIDDYDAFMIPGGMEGAKSLSENKRVLEIIKEAFGKGKIVSAICAGPMVLINSGVAKGKQITGYPGLFENSDMYEFVGDKVAEDGNIITSRGPSLTVYFAIKLIERLAGKEISEKIAKDILLDIMER